MLCHVNADCLDSHGSYICRCKTGFNGNGTFCESNVQEYKFGMQFSPGVGNINYCNICLLAELIDTDECLGNPCHANASCTDNEGSFECQCYHGFSGDGLNCTSECNISVLLVSYFIGLFSFLSQCFMFLTCRY